MIKDIWVTHGMMRAMCQAIKREISLSEGRKLVEKKIKGKKQREKEGEKGTKEKRKRNKERKGERMKELTSSSFDLRCSDGRSSLG